MPSPYPDPYNFQNVEHNASLPGSELNSGIDFAQLLSRLAEFQFGKAAPLQDQSLDLFSHLMKGDTSQVQQMFNPMAAQIRTALGTAEQDATDKVPLSQLGDTIAKLRSNATTTTANAFNQFLQPLFQQATSYGANAASQFMPWVAASGQIAKKPASGGGGMS